MKLLFFNGGIMKYKIFIIIILGTIFTSIIYFHTDKDNLNVLALGDGISTGMTPYHIEGYDYNDYLIEFLNENKQLENYYKGYNEVDETATNLLIKINNNIESINKKIKLKQAIKEADIITISIGMDELNNYAKKNNLGSTKINGYLKKYEEVLKTLRKLNNKKIYIIGLYETNFISYSKINKLNEMLQNLSKQYNAIFINIEDIKKYNEYFVNEKDYYLNYKGQEYIFNKIRSNLEQPTIKII